MEKQAQGIHPFLHERWKRRDTAAGERLTGKGKASYVILMELLFWFFRRANMSACLCVETVTLDSELLDSCGVYTLTFTYDDHIYQVLIIFMR